MTQNKTSAYPEIDFQTCFKVHSIGIEMKKDSSYLENSPYSKPVQDILKSLFTKEKTSQGSAPILDLEDLDLEKEVNLLYVSTKELLTTGNLDPKEKIAVQKTATSQLEKLLDMAAQAKNLKQMREFEERVIRALKTVEEHVRDEFLKELTSEGE